MFRSAFVRCPLDGAGLSPLTDDPLIGQVFAERYKMEACIGEGMTGRVYRARHVRMSRQFAIKVLFGDQASNVKMRMRFAREAESASRLSHPNVVRVVDFGETEQKQLYLVMEYMEGVSLTRLINSEAPLSTTRSRALLRQLAAGLGHAHERGLIHRDLKTDNILVTIEGGAEVAKIVDFGTAVLETERSGSGLTTEGMVLGTPAFMSPEQAAGKQLDPRSDLFSLGVALYRMLSGKMPFDGTPVEIARQNLLKSVPKIAKRNPSVQPDPLLEAITYRLLAREPSHRFQSAANVIAALDGHAPTGSLAHSSEFSTDVGLAGEMEIHGTDLMPPLLRRRRRGMRLAGLLALATVLVVVGYLAGRGGEPGDERGAAATAVTPAAAQPMPADGVSGTPSNTGAVDSGRQEPAIDPQSETAGSRDEAAGRRKRPPAADKPKRRRSRATRRQPAPPKPSTVAAKPAKAATPPPTAAEFQSLHRRAGRLVQRVVDEKGKAAAAKLKRDYLSIPYADSIRSDAIRSDSVRKLRSISRRARRSVAQ